MTVLVTDDDALVLELHSTILRRAGYEVFEASTGAECLEKAHEHHPGLILLDIVLPDMSGVELCRQIKADADLSGVFIILLSGVQTSSEFQAEGLNVGADGYIIKPISNKELVARVQAMERIKRAEDTIRQKEKEQEALVLELKKTLAEIKILKGFIPICSSCKKIRDDEGYWNQLETYITEHSNAVFSHGICPDCAERLKAEIQKISKR